nr:MAG TPA: hypothetical protein [Caudoviricetes sp.]
MSAVVLLMSEIRCVIIKMEKIQLKVYCFITIEE